MYSCVSVYVNVFNMHYVHFPVACCFLLNIGYYKKINNVNLVVHAFNPSTQGAGVMPEWIQPLAALAEEPSSVPSTHMAYNVYNFSSRGPSTFFWLLQPPGMHVMHIYLCRQTVTHITKKQTEKNP